MPLYSIYCSGPSSLQPTQRPSIAVGQTNTPSRINTSTSSAAGPSGYTTADEPHVDKGVENPFIRTRDMVSFIDPDVCTRDGGRLHPDEEVSLMWYCFVYLFAVCIVFVVM